MAKMSAAEKKAAAKTRELKNPLTGQAPNQYTQVTNRELDRDRSVRTREPDKGLATRSRAMAKNMLDSGGLDAPVGYRMDSIDPKYRTFVTGASRMFPNTAAEKGTPAINVPHEADGGVTVQRRAEDLNGPEYRKGLATLKQYGHDPKDPMSSLKEVQTRALDRVSAEHIAAGVNESASQMFYGGHTTTDIPHDLGAQEAHENGVMAARDRFHTAVRGLATHPDFQSQTPGLSHRERMHAATQAMGQAVADTSPNAKWRDTPGAKYEWPNVEQAEEAAHAAVERREPKFITGRIDNIYKAADRVGGAIDTGNFDVHQHGDQVSAPKTIAFRGALIDKDSPDAFKVTDVHEASVVAPWLDTAKAHMHMRTDEFGAKQGPKVAVYSDTPKSQRKGLTMLTKTQNSGKEVPDWGLSRPEAMLTESRATVHALNDHATRSVLADRGLSRSVDHADNVHSFQGATWGSQQLRRGDVNVSPADQYPITRKWHNEGIGVPKDNDIRNLPSASTDHLSPQFGANTRTGRNDSVWPEKF